MKLVIFLFYNNLFIYQVLCTLIYRSHSLYSFLLDGWPDMIAQFRPTTPVRLSSLDSENHFHGFPSVFRRDIKLRSYPGGPTWCSMLGGIKDTTQHKGVTCVLVRTVTDHKNSIIATRTHACNSRALRGNPGLHGPVPLITTGGSPHLYNGRSSMQVNSAFWSKWYVTSPIVYWFPWLKHSN